jgi:hypothetical protein
MNGQKLLNNTLRVNAGFSLLSGIDFIFFDKSIGRILSGGDFESLAPMGFMLIGFAVFVFGVSLMKNVNKYLVGAIIIMDAFWVFGSMVLVTLSSAFFTSLGLILILVIALVIAVFASLQTLGLTKHLQAESI